MIKNLADIEREIERLTEGFKKDLITWLNQGKTGKISLEINTSQGHISRSYIKNEAQI